METNPAITFAAHNYAVELCEQLGLFIELDEDGFKIVYLFILAILTRHPAQPAQPAGSN